MRNELQQLPQVKLRPIFVDVMPPFEAIKEGELWISHKHRTVNLRCPCGCGELTVLSLHPSRWQVGLVGWFHGWLRVGPFRLRQPLLYTRQCRDLVALGRPGS